MDKEDVIAKIALAQFERKEKLRRKISDPAYKYYFRGVRMAAGSTMFVLFSIGMLWMSSREAAFPFIFLFLANYVAFSEIARQRGRFNALVRLMEIEKAENTNHEPNIGANQAPSIEARRHSS